MYKNFKCLITKSRQRKIKWWSKKQKQKNKWTPATSSTTNSLTENFQIGILSIRKTRIEPELEKLTKCFQNEPSCVDIKCGNGVIDGAAARPNRLANGMQRMQMQMEFRQKDGRLQEYGDNTSATWLKHWITSAWSIE